MISPQATPRVFEIRNSFQSSDIETNFRLSELSSDICNLVVCTRFFCLEVLRDGLSEVAKATGRDPVYLPDVLDHFDEKTFPKEVYFQAIFNIELLYIKLYALNEVIGRSSLPALEVSNLKEFRLAFAHFKTDIVLRGQKYLYYIKWLKKDFSQLTFRFFKWDGETRELEMNLAKDIQLFQDWYQRVFEEKIDIAPV